MRTHTCGPAGHGVPGHRTRWLWRRVATAALCGLAMISLAMAEGKADTFVVTTTADRLVDNGCSAAGTGDGCTLREAINAANNNGNFPDTIRFQLPAAEKSGGKWTIVLAGSLASLAGNTTINGPGSGQLTLARGASGTYPLLSTQAATSVALTGITFQGDANSFAPALNNNASTLLVDGCRFTGHRAADGGALFNGGGNSLTLRNTQFQNNSADGAGGAVFSRSGTLVFQNCVFSGNTAAGRGGAILNGGDGAGSQFAISMDVDGCTLENNRSQNSGGAIAHIFGDLLVRNSTLNANQAPAGAGIASDATLRVRNSTVVGNTASGNGGGINSGGDLTLTYSTVARNNASNGGGLYLFGGGSQSMNSSIVAANSAASFSQVSGNYSATFTLIGGTPNLGPLQNNGGLVKTCALLPGSPAIDAGDPNAVDLPPFDQRRNGFPRVVNNRVDQGAFERGSTTPTVQVKLTPGSPGTNATLTATATGHDVDGDSLTYRYTWRVNTIIQRVTGYVSATSDTFSLAAANGGDKGDKVTITVQVSDGTNIGTEFVATQVANSVPAPGTLTPANASDTTGRERTFTAQYMDADGAGDLRYAVILINTGNATAGALRALYDRQTNRLYLRNDADTDWLGGFAPGSGNTIRSGRASLNCQQTTVTSSGTGLTVAWRLTAGAGFTGAKKIFLRASDSSEAYSPWVQKGTWTLSAPAQREESLAPEASPSLPPSFNAS